jgi:glutaredoxin
MLGSDFDREFMLETFPNARTFPQIVINGTNIGGYNELVKYIEDNNFNGTGYSL